MNISVVIPTYRRPQLLKKCIEALIRQKVDTNFFEIIVVSDGPDPSLATEIESYLNLRFFSLAEKKGPAAARNLGWQLATGRLIAFTDDDCIPHCDWLLNFWKAYESRTQATVAFNGKTIVPISPIPTDYELNISHLAEAEFITANCACSKEALELTGGFDEKFTMAWREDSDLQFKFIINNIPIVSVPEAIVTHPVRKPKWGVSLKEERKGIFNALLFKKYPNLYRQKIQKQRPWLYYWILGSFVAAVSGLIADWPFIFVLGIITWFVLTLVFTTKRLKNTSRRWSHILEIVVTSAAIPFLSIYWRWYGALKYRSLFI